MAVSRREMSSPLFFWRTLAVSSREVKTNYFKTKLFKWMSFLREMKFLTLRVKPKTLMMKLQPWMFQRWRLGSLRQIRHMLRTKKPHSHLIQTTKYLRMGTSLPQKRTCRATKTRFPQESGATTETNQTSRATSNSTRSKRLFCTKRTNTLPVISRTSKKTSLTT